MKRTITSQLQQAFLSHLLLEEKSNDTISKYAHDLQVFASYLNGGEATKEIVLSYKAMLAKKYAVTSANSMIAALNSFFRYCGWSDLVVKQFRIQREVFCPEERELSKEEYWRLVKAAEEKKDSRLSLILQTICGTGIRIGELAYITVEAVCKGEVRVNCKGKTRRIFIVSKLQKKLLKYAKAHSIKSGALFITKSGKSINRSVVWRAMKALCAAARVSHTKVFPHNLRHLFARVFYSLEKDIVALADILGHASINTTRIYTVSTGEEHKRKMTLLHLIP